MGAKFLAHSSPSLPPSPLCLFPPLPLLPPSSLPPSPTLRLPAVFSCLFANGQMRHKLGKCSTAETQPWPSSHLIDIYKVPPTAVPFLESSFLHYALFWCLFCGCETVSQRNNSKEKRFLLAHGSRVQPNTAGMSRDQGLGSVGCIKSRPEIRERQMVVLSSHSLLTDSAARKLCHPRGPLFLHQSVQARHTSQSPVSRGILDSVRSSIVKGHHTRALTGVKANPEMDTCWCLSSLSFIPEKEVLGRQCHLQPRTFI